MTAALSTLAECLRLEARPGTRPLWQDCDPAYRQQWLDRAAHLTRLLDRRGVERVCKTGNNYSDPIPADPIISRNEIAGRPGTFLLIRSDGGDAFSAAIEKGGKQTIVEMSFALPDVVVLIDRVLRRDPTVRNEPGLLTKLAAYGDILRLDMARAVG